MRAAATQTDVQMIGRRHQRIANLTQVNHSLFMSRANAGRQLDHAFGDFRRDVAGDFFVLDEAQQIRAGFGQIIIVRIDDLHLEFDTERERLRIDKGFERHGVLWVRSAGYLSYARPFFASNELNEASQTSKSGVRLLFAPLCHQRETAIDQPRPENLQHENRTHHDSPQLRVEIRIQVVGVVDQQIGERRHWR